MIYKFYPSTSTHIVWNQCHDFDFSIRNNADDGYRGIQAITRYRLDYVQFHELSDFLQWLKQYGISYSKDPLQIELPVKCDFLYDLVRKGQTSDTKWRHPRIFARKILILQLTVSAS